MSLAVEDSREHHICFSSSGSDWKMSSSIKYSMPMSLYKQSPRSALARRSPSEEKLLGLALCTMKSLNESSPGVLLVRVEEDALPHSLGGRRSAVEVHGKRSRAIHRVDVDADEVLTDVLERGETV